MKAESIIFDLDGTLWDSSENVACSWNSTIEASRLPGVSGVKLSGADIRGVMGLTMDAIAAKFFPKLSPEAQIELMERCSENENDFLAGCGGRLYEGEEETLGELAKSHRLFIVSNCQQGYIETYLEYSGFEHYFTDYLCWGDTGLTKGETITELMKRRSITSAAYVGDTASDMQAAKAAGIPFVHALYGFGHIDEEVVRAESIGDLIGIFNE
ncbi:MAG: HAD family hydrolase [Oscillospiraceae bacterium]|nr:HAD family hydrolase [Oscillospiraceae bacterium]